VGVRASRALDDALHRRLLARSARSGRGRVRELPRVPAARAVALDRGAGGDLALRVVARRQRRDGEEDRVPRRDARALRRARRGGQRARRARGVRRVRRMARTPATGLDNSRAATPKVSLSNDLTYQLTVTSGDGCEATDKVSVKVLKQVKVPNAFSPNNDGINDKWEIQYLDSYPGCTIDVFNRYGQTVFNSVGYERPWDGTFKGTPLPVGTYYWVIHPKNGREPITGSVTIIR